MTYLLEEITRYIAYKFSRDVSIYDTSFLERCIQIRKSQLGLESDTDYLEYLNKNILETDTLLKSLSNSYSEFFRDPLTFCLLEHVIIPGLVEQKLKLGCQDIRIWSAGCAAGQEAYSLAILAAEFNKVHREKFTFRIFATDISEKELDAAAAGVYESNALKKTRLEYLSGYFTKEGNYYIISPELRQYVDFSYYDLLDDSSASPPQSIYGEFDIIVCSNLLIYYNNDYRLKMLRKLKNSLGEKGLLITGEAEAGFLKSLRGFRQFNVAATIFERI